MGKKSEEELNQILENVRQITENYANAVPTTEEIENIRRAYAGVALNAQNTSELIQTCAHLTPESQVNDETTKTIMRIFGGEGENAQPVYPLTDSPENIEQIKEAVNRLVPPEELLQMQEAAERMKNNSGDMTEMLKEMFSIAQISVSMTKNPAATNELLALQQVLEKQKKFKAQNSTPTGGTSNPASGWKTVYIVLGVLIAVGLILTLAVPNFSEAVGSWFQ